MSKPSRGHRYSGTAVAPPRSPAQGAPAPARQAAPQLQEAPAQEAPPGQQAPPPAQQPPAAAPQAPAPAQRDASPAQAAPSAKNGQAPEKRRGGVGPQHAAYTDLSKPQSERPADQSESTWAKDAVIELRDVHKAFGQFKVLDGVSCRIPKGEITVLMGPSGTGKSVTLRHIVGLLPPDKGEIYVDNRSVPKLNEDELLELRRGIGMLFQDGALFSSMNLFDNVAFPLRQHTKKGEDEIREIVIDRLTEVGLAGAEKRSPNELSGGMRKRAGFARALVMEPKILLFDEPDSGLDPVRTTLLCDLIREISAKYGATSIVVSHDVGAVRRFADNIGILYKGKMRHFGNKKEIEESEDEFVHQFFNASSEGPLGMD